MENQLNYESAVKKGVYFKILNNAFFKCWFYFVQLN